MIIYLVAFFVGLTVQIWVISSILKLKTENEALKRRIKALEDGWVLAD